VSPFQYKNLPDTELAARSISTISHERLMVIRQQRRLKEPANILDQPAVEPLLVQVVEDGVLDDWNASSGIE